MSEFTYRGSKNVSFIVKNNSNKKIRIFNYPLWPGQTRDLLQIPHIGEEDIRASLLKGQLQFMISINQISIVYSDIELIQFNTNQQTFLQNAGVSNGLASDVRTAAQKIADAAIANWFVSATGTTTGTGTSIGDPITPTELSRRLNGLTLTSAGETLVTFDASGDPTHEFVITWNTPNGSQTRIVGTPTSIGLTGTATTSRASNPATQTPHAITDTALPAANSWTAHINQRYRDTQAGATLNTITWIGKDENPTNPKTARVSPTYKGSSAYPFSQSNYALTAITANDSYVVETLPVIGGLSLIGTDEPTSADGDFGQRIIVEDLSFTNPLLHLDGTRGIVFVNCNVDYPWIGGSAGNVWFIGCAFTQMTIYTGSVTVTGCLYKSGGSLLMNPGAAIALTNVLFQNAKISCVGQGYFYINGDTGIFDKTANAVELFGGANMKVVGASYLYGNNNGYGANIEDTSVLHYGSQKPNITGTSNDLIIDGVAMAWTATPYSDRLTCSAVYQSNVGGGPSQPIQAFPIAGSASSVAEGAIGYLAGIGTITKVIFVPNSASAPASGSNSQAMVVGIGNGAGGARSQVAAASIANATQTTAFSNFDMGTITNGSFTDGQILTFKTTLTGTATLPAGMLFVVTK